MKPIQNRGTVFPLLALGAFSPLSALHAQTNGTWTTDGPGNWSDPANWSGGPASGTAAIADFSTLDITGDHLVTLDAPFTIGSLLSQDATTPGNNWTLGGAGPLTLDNGASQPVLNVINQQLTISAPLAGTNGFRKNGTGTLELSGICTYGGNTTLAAGTLKTSGGDDRLPTGTTLAFVGTTGTLDLTTTAQTLAGTTVPDGLAASYTINGGSLTLNGTAARQVGPGGPVTSAHSVALDLSGLSSFTSTASASPFRVGLKSGSTNPAGGGVPGPVTVVLADQNAITASTLAIGDIAASNNGGTSTLRLGRVNTLNVGSINTGASGRSNSNLLFDAARINPSVTIRNTDGTSAVTEWRVGQVANFTASTWTDSVNLSAGTVDALVTTVTVGTADIGSQTGRGGTENASFTMGAGTLETTNLLLGRISGSSTSTITSTMAANGTFSLTHPSGVLKAGSLTLTENTVLAGGTGTRRVSGIFNLTSGTLEATTIQRGAQTGNATATTAINWTDGTIRNLTPSGLSISSVPINLLAGSHVFDATGSAAITVGPTSSVSGSGGLTKTGTGTLSLQGANTYTGPTEVQAGTLAISNSFPNGSTFTVDAAATLELANVTVASLDIDGALNLTGPVTVTGPAGAIPGTLAGVLQYGSLAGSVNLSSNYRNAGFTVGATATDLTVAAGLGLTWTGAGGPTWDYNTTASWNDASSNPEKFFWADSVTFDTTGSAFPAVNLTGELRPLSVVVNEATVDYSFNGTGFIAGGATLTKAGAAKLTLNNPNTLTGVTTIQGGTLEIGSGGTTGSLGSGDIVNDASLVYNRSNDITVANAISGTGSVTKLGGRTMIVTTDNSYSGGTTISAGTLQVGQQTITTGSLGTGAISNNGTLNLNRADGSNPYAYTFANDISGGGILSVGQTGAGAAFDSVVTLTGTNTFIGNINVNSGGLRILNVAALGTGPKTINANNGSNGRSQFYLDGSGGNITVPADFTFRTSTNDANRPAIGNLAGDNVIEGSLILTSGGGDSVVKVDSGSLTLNGQVTTSAPSVRLLRLAGSAGTSGTVNGKLTDGNTPLGVLMQGSNTWTLTNGTSDHTGTTTVNSGTLLINGNQSLATGAVTVNTGGTLGGTGTLGGATTVNAGGTLAPGASVGTLTAAANVTINGTLLIEINGASADRLDVAGTLDISNATVDFDEVAAAGGSPIVIASYGTLSGTQFATVTDLPPGYSINYNYNSLKQIALVTGGNAYGDWETLNGIAGAGADVDSDNDGIANGIEFVLGGDPSGPGSDSNGLLPTISVDGTYLNFVFRRSDESASYAPFVEYGNSLGGWTPAQDGVNGVIVITEDNPGDLPANTDRVTVRVPRSLAAPEARLFARLRVNIP